MSDNGCYVNQGASDEVTASDGMTDRTTEPQVSGREIISDRQDSGLTSPLQNSPDMNSAVEFTSGWREKAFSRMTQREIDCWFGEFTLLLECSTLEM